MNAARRLLVAAPVLRDPNFCRTVVFIVDHTPDGALGVVLNRPTDLALDGLFPAWAARAVAPGFLFLGGPVQPDLALVALGRVASSDAAVGAATTGPAVESGAWQPLLGDVGSINLGVAPPDVGPTIEGFRAFAGYAGWDAGQLDDELGAGGWFVVDAEADDLLTVAPEGLWRRVLRRQGGEMAMAANQPPDPTVN